MLLGLRLPLKILEKQAKGLSFASRMPGGGRVGGGRGAQSKPSVSLVSGRGWVCVGVSVQRTFDPGLPPLA